MSLRIGFDMDGVLADFPSAFHELEVRLFGPDSRIRTTRPEEEEEQQSAAEGATGVPELTDESRRRSKEIWRVIQSTPGFWTSLKPMDSGAVRRVRDLMLQYRWEVFFITQRPATLGETVQRQTQRWLLAQGFDVPSVLVIGGSRGAAAGALRLNYHVDDSPQNCLDVMAEGHARPVLIVPRDNERTMRKARGLGIAVTSTIGECLDLLEQASKTHHDPRALQKLHADVGWR